MSKHSEIIGDLRLAVIHERLAHPEDHLAGASQLLGRRKIKDSGELVHDAESRVGGPGSADKFVTRALARLYTSTIDSAPTCGIIAHD